MRSGYFCDFLEYAVIVFSIVLLDSLWRHIAAFFVFFSLSFVASGGGSSVVRLFFPLIPLCRCLPPCALIDDAWKLLDDSRIVNGAPFLWGNLNTNDIRCHRDVLRGVRPESKRKRKEKETK